MGDTKAWSGLKAEVYSLFGRNPKTNRLVADLAELNAEHATLDVGCGPGAAVRAAASRVQRAAGVDNSAAMVRIAERRSSGLPNVEFQVGAAEALPYADGIFDRVWTVHAFHHWADQDGGVAEALRVLRPGGRLLILERQTNGAHGLSAAAADALCARLAAAGFAEAGVETHGKQLVITAHA